MAAGFLVARLIQLRPVWEAVIGGAAAANTYLTSIVSACSVFFLAAAVAVVTPGHGRWWLATALVGVLSIILVLRGRALTDRRQAIIIVATGLAMATAVAVKYALGSELPVMSVAVAAGVAGLVVMGLVVAAVVPPRVFSPTFRKVVEVTHYVLVVLVIPAVLWLCNLIWLARNH